MSSQATTNIVNVFPSTHNSAETAAIVFFWPWGSNRTIKRFWVETATKGAKKGYQRTMDQTADKPWLFAYTEKCEKEGIEAANAWAMEEVKADRVPWCKPGATTYNAMRVIAQVPMEGAPDGVLQIVHQAADVYSSDWFYNFFDSVGNKLDETQRLLMEKIGRVCKKLNGNHWTELEAKRTAEGKPLCILPPPPMPVKS